MRTFLQLLFWSVLTLNGFAQSNVGLSIGTSKNDTHVESIWYQHQVSDKFSAGLYIKNSGIRYRFVNAIAIDRGTAQFFGATLGYKLYHQDKLRLDVSLSAAFRTLQNKAISEFSLPNSTTGLEIDPNLIVGMKITDQWHFHSGFMIRMSSQFGPTAISDEQFFSSILLNSLSYNKGRNTIALRTYAGPMAGASGDTEKFFWKASIGFQYQFQKPAANQALSFFNF